MSIIFNKAKKVTVLLLSVLLMSTLFVINGAATSVKAATNVNPVQFYSSYKNSYYISTYLTTYIKVNTTGSNEHVYIHA